MVQTQWTRLRREREQRAWSRGYVAEQIGVDIATVGRWERGERLPHSHYRRKLCALFELSAQDLGLLSEAQKGPDDEVADNKENGFLSEPQENPNSATDPQLPVPLINERDEPAPVRLLYKRRRFLVGLGGLGAAALLADSAWIFHSYSSPSSAKPEKPLHQLLDPNTPNWINSLAWSPDGSMLTAANNIPQVTTWNIAKNVLIAAYPTLNQWVNDVTWSNSNRIAAAIADGQHLTGAVQIWMFGASSPYLTLPRAYPLRTVSWSPNGEYLAFAGHSTQVEIWGPLSNNPTSHSIEAVQGAIAINRLQWSTDGTYLAAATDGGTVQVWEAATGKLKSVYQGHQERVINLAWCPREYLIASASVDQTVRVWDALDRRTIVTYQGHTGEVHGIDWSPDGKSIVSAGYDATARVWEARTGKQIALYGPFDSGLLCALWSTNGQSIALGSKQQGIYVWQAPSY